MASVFASCGLISCGTPSITMSTAPNSLISKLATSTARGDRLVFFPATAPAARSSQGCSPHRGDERGKQLEALDNDVTGDDRMAKIEDFSIGPLEIGPLDDGQVKKARENIRRERSAESYRPLSVAIMGQTGVGKTSLLNCLFGTDLAVGHVRPVTRRPEPVPVPGTSGHMLTFWDMPGIGESGAADETYLAMYLERLIRCDVAIWAFHADSRSTAYDEQCLRRLLDGVAIETRRLVMSKLTFVLTKADTLTPPPWIFDMRGDRGTFNPGGALLRRLEEKAAYYESVFLEPHGDTLLTSTYGTGEFTVSDDRLGFDRRGVHYRGHFSQRVCDTYSERYPAHREVFSRLRDNHRVLPCSALFRFNLTRLMTGVVNRLGPTAVFRFRRLLQDVDALTDVPVATARTYGNVMIWDGERGAKAFDLTEIPL
ncbi:GTPase family protein [Streptosporangium oxazolinicum]